MFGSIARHLGIPLLGHIVTGNLTVLCYAREVGLRTQRFRNLGTLRLCCRPQGSSQGKGYGNGLHHGKGQREGQWEEQQAVGKGCI